ncbi:hypothetical protein [Carnimonas bestiolae]|uniref:hypothetical protein n=1 Tax=Carnimonas bestiolae TaxID=3402172 RepID=UPI003EDB845B
MIDVDRINEMSVRQRSAYLRQVEHLLTLNEELAKAAGAIGEAQGRVNEAKEHLEYIETAWEE